MDDHREGCFPESYVQPADAVSIDETAMQQPAADEGTVAAVQAPLVLTLLFVTDHIIREGNAISQVRPFVSTLAFEPTDV